MHIYSDKILEDKKHGPTDEWSHLGVHIKLPKVHSSHNLFVNFNAPNVYCKSPSSDVPSARFRIVIKNGRSKSENTLFGAMLMAPILGNAGRQTVSISGTFDYADPEGADLYVEWNMMHGTTIQIQMPEPNIPAATFTAIMQT